MESYNPWYVAVKYSCRAFSTEMPREKLANSRMRVVFSPIRDDFLLTAGQRLYKPARISTKQRAEVPRCSFTAVFARRGEAGCGCRRDRDLHCSSAAASSCFRSDGTQHTGVFLLIGFFWAAVIPHKKNSQSYICKKIPSLS